MVDGSVEAAVSSLLVVCARCRNERHTQQTSDQHRPPVTNGRALCDPLVMHDPYSQHEQKATDDRDHERNDHSQNERENYTHELLLGTHQERHSPSDCL